MWATKDSMLADDLFKIFVLDEHVFMKTKFMVTAPLYVNNGIIRNRKKAIIRITF